MRNFHIFILNIQRTLEHRFSNFIWFLISLINPLVLLLYWLGFYRSSNAPTAQIQETITYYILLVIIGATLMVHIEGDVAYDDIQLGELSNYLLKPFSYLWWKFFLELPWRLIQGFFGLVVLILVKILFPQFIVLVITPEVVVITFFVSILAYILSFYFKMVVGLTALWLTDFSGFNQMVEVVILMFAGYIMPLNFYPAWLKQIALLLPFPYIIYYPVIALQGKLALSQLGFVIIPQIIWIIVFKLIFNLMWVNGIKKYSGVGN